MARQLGKIKSLVTEKGYGFITTHDGKSDVFFHHSVVEDKGFKYLELGQEVEFEIEKGEENKGDKKKGPRASYVAPV